MSLAVIDTCENYHSDSGIMSNQDFGLQLRLASEKGRLQEVRKMLAVRAPILMDSVSYNLKSGYPNNKKY